MFFGTDDKNRPHTCAHGQGRVVLLRALELAATALINLIHEHGSPTARGLGLGPVRTSDGVILRLAVQT